MSASNDDGTNIPISNKPRQSLDDILGAALDELDDENQDVQDTKPAAAAAAAASTNTDGKDNVENNKDQNATMESFMQQLQSDLVDELGSLQQQSSSSQQTRINLDAKPSVNSTIDSLLENMSLPDEDLPEEQAMLEQMMKEFEKLIPGSGEDPTDSLVEGMMQQMLSKEIMYEPMKQVCDKFPSWLQQHKDNLSEEEYQQKCRQHKAFQDLVKAYETEPNNVEKLVQLMEQVQEFGQPPTEIVHEIAPGLELDADGMPKNLMDPNGDCNLM